MVVGSIMVHTSVLVVAASSLGITYTTFRLYKVMIHFRTRQEIEGRNHFKLHRLC